MDAEGTLVGTVDEPAAAEGAATLRRRRNSAFSSSSESTLCRKTASSVPTRKLLDVPDLKVRPIRS
jgi:hypothetical protein